MGLFIFSFITLTLGVLAFPAEEEYGLETSPVTTNAVKDDLETSDTYGIAYYPGYYGGGVGSNIIPGPGFGVGAIAPTPLLTTSLLATPVFSAPIVGHSYNPSYSTSFPGTSVKVRPHISYDHGNTFKYGGSYDTRYGYGKGIPINEYQRRQPVYIGLN
ncbi:uncharacterized protein LOC119641351 [Glossina fuscipes]|uniref:Uncharacterized protein LOC119641351 n=1 Tax=Glossina fuscipes TaxID=7396 RepID=A0A9C6DXE7_9MUSC|nr:uncharacterized protein LOC119641351 [Glossina fuscipes]KAI9577677.1 hypothetical protein GQX74_013371 [Glossina fuscipes]